MDMESSLEGDCLDVGRLIAGSGGMRLDAQGTLTSIVRRTGAFTATASPLNLDEVLALVSGLSAPGAAASSGDASPLDVQITLTAPEGTLGGYRFEKLSSTLHVTPGHFTMQPLRFGMFGGNCVAELKVALAGTEPATAISGRVDGIDMTRLLREMAGTSSMSGRMDATVSLTTRGSSSAEMLRGARATGRATIVDGEISGLEVVRSAVLAFGKPSGAPVAGSGSHFTRIDATFTLGDQTLRSTDIAFASRDLGHDRERFGPRSGRSSGHARERCAFAGTDGAGGYGSATFHPGGRPHHRPGDHWRHARRPARNHRRCRCREPWHSKRAQAPLQGIARSNRQIRTRGRVPDGRGAAEFTQRLGGVPSPSTIMVIAEAESPPRYTRSVAFLKSAGPAVGISMKTCGLRSISGNHELWTCTIMRCPLRKAW